MQKEKSAFKFNPLIVATLIVFVYLIAIYTKHEILITEDILFQEFKGDDFENYLEVMSDFRAVKYISLTLLFIASMLATFALLFFGVSVFGFNLHANVVFNIAVLSSISEVLKEIYIIFWFSIEDAFISSEIFNFYPLSVFSLLNDENMKFPLSYITQSIDFFLSLKVAIMILALKFLAKPLIQQPVKTVLIGYLVPLFVIYALAYIFM